MYLVWSTVHLQYSLVYLEEYPHQRIVPAALRLQSIDIRLLLTQGTPDSIDGLRIQYHLDWDQ